ncbi:contractile injection system tape measure protein [Flavilitoribacter nigricans]|uniref:Uncharacterized protein n=1 Tax=Flavilitoribacter nigricans (strain ATCC 23147 / DSM 23189 / NBRC 102662 / NCIMB 1420 / SS-2) TaxID=1122177 RepID=A0A2D0MYC8_FLAN2|nr:contractile injection system tape measure protein [Flavilitoribacter nigricans]PHN01255.1 hypothetical protein CRP01_37895 [Flavilitoribacter nigricans DSM 23189 = NBRC 102662]
MQHQIQKQILEVVVRESGRAEAVSAKVTDLFNYQVLPQLERLFDELGLDDELIVIDRLEIETAVNDERSLARQLPNRMLSAIEQALKKELKYIPEVSDKPVRENPKQHLTKPVALLRVFTYFLETGTFPWWYAEEAFHDFEAELIEEGNIKEVIAIIQARMTRPQCMRRLIHQCSNTVIQAVLQEDIPLSNRSVWDHPLQDRQPEVFRRQLLEWAFGTARSNRQMDDLLAVLDAVPEQENHDTEDWSLPEMSSSSREVPLRPPATDEYYIHNAGLVLLAHMLEVFLEHFGLVRDGHFVAPTAQERAIHLLEYLASGRQQVAEPEQLFHKFLCARPLNAPVARRVALSDAEKDEAENLLGTILQHWPKMQSTDLETLRSSFLQRPGKLYRKQGAWRIRVERETIDILLDFLPWSIAVVHLPWLDGVVWVEW